MTPETLTARIAAVVASDLGVTSGGRGGGRAEDWLSPASARIDISLLPCVAVSVEARPKAGETGSVGRGWGTRSLGTGVSVALTLLAALLAGLGWLYVLRGLDWLSVGPSIHDSLPLLQLAGGDAQPLGRVVIAWLAAGLVAGVVLVRLPRRRRGAVGAILGLVLLLLASQASFSVTRNVNFGHALFSRAPGLGPWLEAGLFAVGCLLPGRALGPGFESPASGGRLKGRLSGPGRPGRPSGLTSLRVLGLANLRRVRDRCLRRGEHRDAGQHEADREEVPD
jgi:hypothetical protein